ncbi:MAG: hypothetical protein AAF211_10520 [Myxococcota bacterium]
MVLWLTLLTTTAAATPCEPYPPVRLRADLAMVTDAIADGDLADARARLGTIGERLPCSSTVVDARVFAKFARYMALTHQLASDDAGTTRWLLSSRAADPDLPWNPAAFPAGHVLRARATEADWPLTSTLTQGLKPPRDGGVFLNGHLAFDASAPEGVPFLAQAFDGDGRRVDAWWQEGGRFPVEYLSKRFRDVAWPRWWRP